MMNCRSSLLVDILAPVPFLVLADFVVDTDKGYGVLVGKLYRLGSDGCS